MKYTGKTIYKFHRGFIANSSGVAYFLHVFKIEIPKDFTADEMIESFGIEKDSMIYKLSEKSLRGDFEQIMKYRTSSTTIEGKEDGFGTADISFCVQEGEEDICGVHLLTLSPKVKIIYNDHYDERLDGY